MNRPATAEEEDDVLDGDESSGSESQAELDSKNEDGSDDQESERKNTSNWKKMSEALKTERAENAKSKQEISELKNELKEIKEWANDLYEKADEKPFTKKEAEAVHKADESASKLEEKIFVLENKDAKEHIEDIRAARDKFNMDFDEAWTYVKAKLPAESKSSRDFEISKRKAEIPKDLTKVSPEDALKLPRDVQKQWRAANGYGS